MSNIALTNKAAKLLKLCEVEGFKSIEELVASSATDSLCPAICMTEGCDFTATMEPDQDAGYCNECCTCTVKSALILADII